MPANSAFTEIISTTYPAYQGKFADNVSRTNELLNAMQDRGRKMLVDSGRTLVHEIDWAENSTFQYYDGYEQLAVTPSDVLSAAEYNWKQASVNVLISGKEMRMNDGSRAVSSLIEARFNNGVRTMGNNLSLGVYSDGTGFSGKQINGLSLLVADNPTSSTVVGGINQASVPIWQNQRYRALTDGTAVASSTNIQNYMTRLYESCSRGPDRPNVIVFDPNFYSFYSASLQSAVRFTRDDSYGIRSDGLMFNDAVVLREATAAGIGANKGYFLNTDYLFWCVHPDADVAMLPDVRAVNQDAVVATLIWMGNLTCSNRAVQGVLLNT